MKIILSKHEVQQLNNTAHTFGTKIPFASDNISAATTADNGDMKILIIESFYAYFTSTITLLRALNENHDATQSKKIEKTNTKEVA